MSHEAVLTPFDRHNESLRAEVRPADWVNPDSAEKYNLVVIGAGTAGLVAAAGAAGLGARVALIERSLMGGDCLNSGCVPSKALIRSARAFRAVRDAGEFGVHVRGSAEFDFAAATERMRRLRAEISPHDSAARFRDLGVDVFFGNARFSDSRTVAVAGAELKFRKAVIATGARAAIPKIPGLKEIPFLTNETLFSLTELPKRLVVIGAGPIGCEMAQAFSVFGSQVTLIESSHGVLPAAESDARVVIEDALRRDGVRLLCCSRDLQVSCMDAGAEISVDSHGTKHRIAADKVLVATGRAPNVTGLGLEAAGVEFDEKSGVRVNDRMQTTNPRIFAAGDVCSRFRFTHAADFAARLVIGNSLFPGRSKFSRLVIPSCTYTTPEVAQVGLSAEEAEASGIAVDTYTQQMSDTDRAVLDGDTAGFVRIHTYRNTDRIAGATIVAAHAGDLIAVVTTALTHGIGLKKIASVIQPYPTQADAVRRIGDQYNRTRLSPFVKRLLNWWMSLTR